MTYSARFLTILSMFLFGCAGTSSLNGVYTGNGDNADLRIFVENGYVAMTLVGDGCLGSMEGSVQIVSENNWRVIAVDAEMPCVLDLRRDGPLSFNVAQGPGCTSYHGARCGFSGFVTKSQ